MLLIINLLPESVSSPPLITFNSKAVFLFSQPEFFYPEARPKLAMKSFDIKSVATLEQTRLVIWSF